MIVYYYYTRIFLMHFVCEEDCGGEGWKRTDRQITQAVYDDSAGEKMRGFCYGSDP